MKTNAYALRAATAAILLCAIPLPAEAETMAEIEVEAQVENGPLRGTMLLPAESAGQPAIVIIPGSGPTDRDGNNVLGVNAAPYRMLAEALAVEGIPSIRIDKRGMFASIGSFGNPNAVTFDDYAADALAWIEEASQRAGTDCGWLLGHSEGGLVALLAAQRAGPSLCGVILIAAPGRKMSDVLRDQLRSSPANEPILPDAFAAIDTLERGRKVDVSGFHPSLQVLFAPVIQDFLIDAFSRDPAALIAGLDLPVLIVQGDNDLQVKTDDAEALARAQPGAELLVVSGMNHLLKTTPVDVEANLASYANPSLPLADTLVARIAEFVKRKR